MTLNDTAKALFTQSMESFIGNDFDESVDLLSQAIVLDPYFKLAMASRGSAHLELDNIDKAIADFDRAIEMDSSYARAFHLRGLAWESGGDYDGAIEDLNKAIELDPEYGVAYYSRANLHVKMGNDDRATDDIEKVTHLSNRNIETFANENNVWRSQHLRLESMLNAEMDR